MIHTQSVILLRKYFRRHLERIPIDRNPRTAMHAKLERNRDKGQQGQRFTISDRFCNNMVNPLHNRVCRLS